MNEIINLALLPLATLGITVAWWFWSEHSSWRRAAAGVAMAIAMVLAHCRSVQGCLLGTDTIVVTPGEALLGTLLTAMSMLALDMQFLDLVNPLIDRCTSADKTERTAIQWQWGLFQVTYVLVFAFVLMLLQVVTRGGARPVWAAWLLGVVIFSSHVWSKLTDCRKVFG